MADTWVEQIRRLVQRLDTVDREITALQLQEAVLRRQLSEAAQLRTQILAELASMRDGKGWTHAPPPAVPAESQPLTERIMAVLQSAGRPMSVEQIATALEYENRRSLATTIAKMFAAGHPWLERVGRGVYECRPLLPHEPMVSDRAVRDLLEPEEDLGEIETHEVHGP